MAWGCKQALRRDAEFRKVMRREGGTDILYDLPRHSDVVPLYHYPEYNENLYMFAGEYDCLGGHLHVGKYKADDCHISSPPWTDWEDHRSTTANESAASLQAREDELLRREERLEASEAIFEILGDADAPATAWWSLGELPQHPRWKKLICADNPLVRYRSKIIDEVMKHRGEDLMSPKSKARFNFVVCDEAHLVKNRASTLHKAVKCLPRDIRCPPGDAPATACMGGLGNAYKSSLHLVAKSDWYMGCKLLLEKSVDYTIRNK
ncbi:Uu.00g111070.m01.CDS01 [Anthostomella pinea]|uniref:Uu.00g111070.m01.CDS01 n=1 Tax=Anthostomella pinea TaxID=933095 RepID=A0AAI8VG32_9PEZI|nr:Uu.00g111070.m01.CDS01 [Anthostomella pinea]